jgi:hypothetical protein
VAFSPQATPIVVVSKKEGQTFLDCFETYPGAFVGGAGSGDYYASFAACRSREINI